MKHTVISFCFEALNSLRKVRRNSREYKAIYAQIRKLCFNPATESEFRISNDAITKLCKIDDRNGIFAEYVIALELDDRHLPTINGYVFCFNDFIETKNLQCSFRKKLNQRIPKGYFVALADVKPMA